MIMKIKQLTPNVYVTYGMRGCNPGFVTTRQGNVIIDSPWMPSEVIRWHKEIASMGEVRYLINTEPHPDHCTGNGFLPGIGVAHRGIRDALLLRSLEGIERQIKDMDPQGAYLMKEYKMKLPEITFTQRLSLHLGDHSFELLNLPGHTASQTAVYIPEERVVFTGDNVVYKVKTWLAEAKPYPWLQSLKRIEELPVDIIVPGHGDDVCHKSYLKEQARIIRRWIAAIKQAIKQGMSQEETEKRVGLLPPDPYPPDGKTATSYVDKLNVARLYELWSPTR